MGHVPGALSVDLNDLVPDLDVRKSVSENKSSCNDLSERKRVCASRTTSCQRDILDKSALPTLWQQFGKAAFLFKHDNIALHKARYVKNESFEFGLEERDRPQTHPTPLECTRTATASQALAPNISVDPH